MLPWRQDAFSGALFRALDLDGWRWLDLGASIEDPTLAAPLPVSALVNAAKVDDALALALLRKRNPVIEQALARRAHPRGAFRSATESLARTRGNLPPAVGPVGGLTDA